MQESENRAMLREALGMHGRWKTRLRRMIDSGNIAVTREQAGAADRCDFGLWLENNQATLGASAEYAHAAELHRQFHQTVAQVIGLIEAGNKPGASQALDINGDISNVSAELSLALLEWQQKL